MINQRQDNALLPDDPDVLNGMISQCHLCDLSKSRSQSMSGFGSYSADIMFIDAYVSIAEDESNNFFAGRSGVSLGNMIQKVLKLRLEDIFLTHAIKCKPLGSNTPSPSEFSSCKPYLFKQIELIKPKIIVTLGEDAYRLLSGDSQAFEQVRGQNIAFGTAALVPIYHPQFLLRNPSLKRVTLTDLQKIKSLL